MATFKFGRTVDIHWNGFEVVGPADTVFSIPDQLYEEFEADFRAVEPSLVWIDTNEFQTLENQVSTAVLSADLPIAITTSTTGKTISLNSGTALNGYLLVADGAGGTIWNPASTSGLTSVVGISPISTVISGGTVSVSIDQASLSVNDAQSSLTLRTYVKNASGSTITKGQVVYITGADGTNALIGLASNTSDASSSKTLGIAANTMTNNAFGYVIENGQLSNIDTSAATAGSSVWLGSTPGSYQFTVPAEPNHAVYLGVVTKANVSTGEIVVKVQNGYELNELHDVFTTGVSTSLPLVYNATSDGWIAQALSSVGIADNAIVAAKIAAAAVGSAALATGSVTDAKIASNAVTSGHIAAGAVGTAALATGAVVSSKIATGAVTSGHIATGAVGSAALAASSVVSAAIAASAVTSGHIAAGAVGSAAIASGSINSTHIGANAVVAGDIAANAVTSGNIAAGAVNTAKIDSTGGSANWVLTANGSGGATFAAAPVSGSYWIIGTSPISASAITSAPAGNYALQNASRDGLTVNASSATTSVAVNGTIRVSPLSSVSTVTTSNVSGWSNVIDVNFGTSAVNDIAYGNSLFVAVGDDGKLSTSINGTSWTSRTSGFGTTSNNILGIGYGNSLWIAVGQGGKCFTSIDGTSWTSRTSGHGTTLIYDVVYGGTTWVTVGLNNKVYTSTDGITWTSRSAGFSNTDSQLYNVEYLNSSTYIVCGSQSGTTPRVATSTDGASWTSRTTAGLSGTSALGSSFGSSLYVVNSNTGVIATAPSTDLATWTNRGSSGSSGGRIDFSGSRFRKDVSAGRFALSTNGIDWTLSAATASDLTNATSLARVLYDGSKYVAIAQGSGSISWGVSSSTTGIDVGGPINILLTPITTQTI